MTTRIRLNEKKGVAIVALFVVLTVYSYLKERYFLTFDLNDVQDNLYRSVTTDFSNTISRTLNVVVEGKNNCVKLVHSFRHSPLKF
jgi:hypothetical protein